MRGARHETPPEREEGPTGPAALGVAVVGLGVGEQHARAFAADERCAIRWLCDLDPGRSEALCGALGGAATERFSRVLDDEAVGIVSIASYDDAHYEQALAALRAGRHVFCEKPLCRSQDEAAALKQAASAARRQLRANLVLRGAPLYVWLRDAIAAGELGEVYAFDGDYLYGRIEKITEGWRRDVEGYSVMQGGGVHLVDLMLMLTGQRPATVTAVGNGICTRDTAFRYDDFVAATYQFDSGLVGRVTANFGCVHRHQHVLRVFGTRATVLYDDQGPRVLRGRSGEATPLTLDPLPPGKGVLIPEFIDAVWSGVDPSPTLQHEVDLVSVCAAADEALARGERVAIKYV